MAKKIQDFTRTRAELTDRWNAINADIQKLAALDQEKLILNTQARKILKFYLDRFKDLAAGPTAPKTIKEADRLLESLRYLVKVLLKMSKKKRSLR